MATGIASPFAVCIGTDSLFTGVGVSSGQEAVLIKAAALQWDATATVLAVLTSAGSALGCSDPHRLLRATATIRLCTSVGQTTVLLRTGQPVGLLVSADLADEAIRVLAALGLPPGLAAVIPDLDAPGARPQIESAYHHLLSLGARSAAICLNGSRTDSQAEQSVRRLIEHLYPPHSLGGVPILLASTAAVGGTDARRLMALALDGYVRRTMVTYLNHFRAALTGAGFRGTLLVAEGNGRLSPLSRVRPALAPLAAQGALRVVAGRLVAQMGLSQGLVMRIGTVNTEICLVGGDSAAVAPMETLLPERGAGGAASTVRRRSGRFILTPPESLPQPGPACFGWGGRSPTLVDLLLVIGYLGLNSLGEAGRPLDRDAARDALAGLVGHDADGVEAVALQALHDVASDLAAEIRRRLEQGGLAASQPAFLACGRIGGLLVCAVAEHLGWRTVHVVAGGGLVLTLGAAHMEPGPGPAAAILAAAGRMSGPEEGAETGRVVYLGATQGWRQCPVHWAPRLSAGTELPGPVLVEAVDAVHWVPPGWHYIVQPGGLARLERR